MKKTTFYSLFSILVLLAQSTKAQEIAITERGDSVLLFSNGTWDYYSNYNSIEDELTEIKTNDQVFSKPKTSVNKVNGSNQAYEIWYDDRVWKRVPPGELNPEADVALKLIKGDVYAMVIYEELEIPMENLSQIALDNAVNVAPDMEMVDREYRLVNNDSLIWMRMDGTTQGMKIAYYSYYSANEKGSIQFHTFTGQKLLDKYKNEIENLLNGLVTSE
jgi:hypothetical protein